MRAGAFQLSVGRSFSELEKNIHDGFVAVSERLDRIEFHATGQGRRIEILEDHVRVISRKIGLDTGR